MRKGLYDAERYEVLAAVYPKKDMRVSRENVGTYRTKVTRAGEFIYLSCYPLITENARKAEEARMREMDDALKERKDMKLRARWNKYNNARRTADFPVELFTGSVDAGMERIIQQGVAVDLGKLPLQRGDRRLPLPQKGKINERCRTAVSRRQGSVIIVVQ